MTIALRSERPQDEQSIGRLIERAFASATHASGTEAAIVERLRGDGDLSLGIVAAIKGRVVGYAAFSPVHVEGRDCGWFGLGPVAVEPELQHTGIGAALIGEGLVRLQRSGAGGCVVLGDPAYYRRFGFQADSDFKYPGVPPGYFQRLVFRGQAPRGTVAYAPAFAG